MKLTEDDFEVINFYHENDGKIKISQQLQKQILDDYEKARKWDKAIALENRPDIATIMKENVQNRKLQELIEKELKSLEGYVDYPDGIIKHTLQSLLKESKE